MDTHSFLLALTVVLGAAALTTVVSQRFRQPLVLGYILAGLIIGPNVPIPVVADRQIVQTLSGRGLRAGRFFGWTTLESVFTGPIVATSSTTIIAKAFDEQEVRGPLRELVVGICFRTNWLLGRAFAGVAAVLHGGGYLLGQRGR